MYTNALYKKRNWPLMALLLALTLIFSGFHAQAGEDEEVEVIERPLLADDIPAMRVKPSAKEHDHAKHKKKEPVVLPGAEGKLQIGDRKGDPRKGEEIYKKACIYCHGNKGLGDGITVIGLRVKPKSFIRKEGILSQKDQEIFDTITYGVKTNYQLDMPAWGPNYSVEERLDVLAYVKELAKKTKKAMGEEGSDEKHTHKDHGGNHKH